MDFTESIRMLRSNLGAALAELDQPTLMVTSAHAGEGKTLTCTNLAVSFAQAGLRVVVVDLDLRHPDVHQALGGHNQFGVSEVLLGRRKLEESFQYVDVPGRPGGDRAGLYFLATGQEIANPTELLGLTRMDRLLDQLPPQADLVLLDSSPVLEVADGLVVGRMAAATLLVCEAGKTRYQAVEDCKTLLGRNRVNLIGVTLNRFRPADADGRFTSGTAASTTSGGGRTPGPVGPPPTPYLHA